MIKKKEISTMSFQINHALSYRKVNYVNNKELVQNVTKKNQSVDSHHFRKYSIKLYQ